MEAQAELGAPNPVAELQNRIAVLEKEVLRERAARELAEKQRDDVCHELVVLRTQADRLSELVKQKPKGNTSSAGKIASSKPKTETADLVQLDIPDIEPQFLPKPFSEEDMPDVPSAAPVEVVAAVTSPCVAPVAHKPAVSEPEVSEPEPVSTAATKPCARSMDTVAPVTAPPAVAEAAPVQPVVAAVAAAPVATQGPTPASDPVEPANLRAAVRVSTKMTASYWRAGMRVARACTICDKSSGGARLDLSTAAPSAQEKPLTQGDQITLMFESPFERTSVACLIMWIKGTQCGVRYAGQFHTEMKQPRTQRRTEPTPPQKAKGGLFSSRR